MVICSPLSKEALDITVALALSVCNRLLRTSPGLIGSPPAGLITEGDALRSNQHSLCMYMLNVSLFLSSYLKIRYVVKE